MKKALTGEVVRLRPGQAVVRVGTLEYTCEVDGTRRPRPGATADIRFVEDSWVLVSWR